MRLLHTINKTFSNCITVATSPSIVIFYNLNDTNICIIQPKRFNKFSISYYNLVAPFTTLQLSIDNNVLHSFLNERNNGTRHIVYKLHRNSSLLVDSLIFHESLLYSDHIELSFEITPNETDISEKKQLFLYRNSKRCLIIQNNICIEDCGEYKNYKIIDNQKALVVLFPLNANNINKPDRKDVVSGNNGSYLEIFIRNKGRVDLTKQFQETDNVIILQPIFPTIAIRHKSHVLENSDNVTEEKTISHLFIEDNEHFFDISIFQQKIYLLYNNLIQGKDINLLLDAQIIENSILLSFEVFKNHICVHTKPVDSSMSIRKIESKLFILQKSSGEIIFYDFDILSYAYIKDNHRDLFFISKNSTDEQQQTLLYEIENEYLQRNISFTLQTENTIYLEREDEFDTSCSSFHDL